GSLVIIVVWVYYSAQILLFGSEFTKVWTKRRGSGFKVAKTAEVVTAEARAEQGLGPKHKAGSKRLISPARTRLLPPGLSLSTGSRFRPGPGGAARRRLSAHTGSFDGAPLSLARERQSIREARLQGGAAHDDHRDSRDAERGERARMGRD